jgi:hypothetical protein
VTFDPEIPFRSLSRERMEFLDRYLQGWCIWEQRYVMWWNHGDVTLHGKIRVLQRFTFALHTSICVLHQAAGYFPVFVLTRYI